MAAKSLTDAEVRSFKVEGQSRVVVYDAKCPGLCLRVSASSKAWSLVYRPQGSSRQRRFTIGDYPTWSLAQARERGFALRRLVQEGGDPVAAAQERKSALTVGSLIEQFIKRRAKVKLRSWRDYEALLNRDVVPVFGMRRADEIARIEVAALLDKITARAPVVANRVMNVLSAVYSWGVSEGLVAANPVTGLRRRHEEVAKERFLSDDEIAAFWKASDAISPAYRDAFRLILLTGQRPGECAGICAEEVDLEKGIWTLPAARVKNKRRHQIPLVGEASHIVERLCRATKSGRLLLSPRGKPLSAQNLAKAFERLRADVFEQPATPHDLRRTAATILARLEVDRMTVGYVLNHASITKSSVTGAVYDRHDYVPQKQRALEALDLHIAFIASSSGRIPSSDKSSA